MPQIVIFEELKGAMNTAEIKTQLQQLIERESDMGVLQAIYTILVKTGLDPKLREKLTMNALKSEEDIRANRLFSKEDVIRRTDPPGRNDCHYRYF